MIIYITKIFAIRQDRGKIMTMRDKLKRTGESKTKPKEKKRKDYPCQVQSVLRVMGIHPGIPRDGLELPGRARFLR